MISAVICCPDWHVFGNAVSPKIKCRNSSKHHAQTKYYGCDPSTSAFEINKCLKSIDDDLVITSDEIIHPSETA